MDLWWMRMLTASSHIELYMKRSTSGSARESTYKAPTIQGTCHSKLDKHNEVEQNIFHILSKHIYIHKYIYMHIILYMYV